ncbi:hypothetical protein [Micromonospora sp. NPDC092111]|uniref:hypothetical protein n=1 Tax=Micromonospora sp. NPDC092111 TaxID=3364289 RepID=UPI00382CA1E0
MRAVIVRRFAVGDPVIGLRDVLSAPGAQAEQVVLGEDAVRPRRVRSPRCWRRPCRWPR